MNAQSSITGHRNPRESLEVGSGEPGASLRIGWVSAVEPGTPAEAAVAELRARIAAALREDGAEGPGWEFPLFPFPGRMTASGGDPLTWLEYGATEKLVHGCDLVIVVTDAPLLSADRGFAHGALSRELETVVLSLRPFATLADDRPAFRIDGAEALLLHALALFFGEREREADRAVTWHVGTPAPFRTRLARLLPGLARRLRRARPSAGEGRGLARLQRFTGCSALLREALANRP